MARLRKRLRFSLSQSRAYGARVLVYCLLAGLVVNPSFAQLDTFVHRPLSHISYCFTQQALMLREANFSDPNPHSRLVEFFETLPSIAEVSSEPKLQVTPPRRENPSAILSDPRVLASLTAPPVLSAMTLKPLPPEVEDAHTRLGGEMIRIIRSVRPVVSFLDAPAGAGKSTLAKKLQPKMRVIDLDLFFKPHLEQVDMERTIVEGNQPIENHDALSYRLNDMNDFLEAVFLFLTSPIGGVMEYTVVDAYQRGRPTGKNEIVRISRRQPLLLVGAFPLTLPVFQTLKVKVLFFRLLADLEEAQSRHLGRFIKHYGHHLRDHAANHHKLAIQPTWERYEKETANDIHFTIHTLRHPDTWSIQPGPASLNSHLFNHAA